MRFVVGVGEHLDRPPVPAGVALDLHGDVLYHQLGTFEDRPARDYLVGELHLLVAEAGHVAYGDVHRVDLLDVVL